KDLKGHFNSAMMSFTPSNFYVFKKNKYPYLSENIQINLELDYYDSFAKDYYNVFFDKRDFSTLDVEILKSFNYGN
ncbi:MAG: hypothetical protein Q4B43_11180, partial [Bacteroidota bacterium]|nr:hypothetical protein [Bacteroidota bacterium]